VFAIVFVLALAFSVLGVGVAYANKGGCPNSGATDPGRGADSDPMPDAAPDEFGHGAHGDKSAHGQPKNGDRGC
jgi:hypothetical protein